MDLSVEELSLIGSSVYLCEGTKARHYGNGRNCFAIEFTNKDPRLISMFLRFMRQVLEVDENRVKAELFIYPDHSEKVLIKHWSNVTGIPKERFNKTIKLCQKNARYKPNPIGTIKIRYAHKEHFLKLQGIIEQVFGGVA